MTVTYSAKVATAKFSCFFKLLIRWRGSIYKILWKEFAIFSAAYFTLSFIYRLILTDTQKRYFEKGAEYCAQFNNLIPVAFVLGFYVNHIASRWWEKFRTLPWPGRTAMFVTAHLFGHSERARLMRRTIMRYMCLSYVITMSSISPPVRKRFPKWEHMTKAGFLLKKEEEILENLKTPYNKFFVPLVWASALVTRARKEGLIKDDFAVKTLIDEINDFRTRSFQLFNFDWVNIPLVYTQVVTLAVYTFFLSCLMGRQYLDNGHLGDMYFPLFTFLQFFFYMGWLKVAETMLNPFGEDDDDFDINYLIDQHLKVSYLVVDGMHAEHPELIRDQYWDTVEFDLPYTEETQQYKQEPRRGSAIDLDTHHHHHHYQSHHHHSLPESGTAIQVSNSASSRRILTRNNNPIPSLQSNQSAASSGNSVFQTHHFGAKEGHQKLLSRHTSRSSSSSEASDGSMGFFKSLKKAIAYRTRRKSINTTDDCELKLHSKPIRLTPSIPGSFQSDDLPFLGLDVCHDNAETIFQMSESESDESLSSRTKQKQHRGRQRSREDVDGPIVFNARHYNPHHHHHQYHHQYHHQDNRRGHVTGHQGASEHGVRRGHAAKDGGRYNDDEILFPINELPDDSSTAIGVPETEEGCTAGFTSGVTEVMENDPEVGSSVRRMSSRSAGAEQIGGVTGNGAKCTVGSPPPT